MRNEKWVSDYLRDSNFDNPNIVGYFSGESNHNYVFESDGRKYVLRRNLQEKGSVNRLKQESKILNFLANQGIDFAPGSIVYDSEKEVHITSFVGTEDITLKDLDSSQLEEWVSKIVKKAETGF